MKKTEKDKKTKAETSKQSEKHSEISNEGEQKKGIKVEKISSEKLNMEKVKSHPVKKSETVKKAGVKKRKEEEKNVEGEPLRKKVANHSESKIKSSSGKKVTDSKNTKPNAEKSKIKSVKPQSLVETSSTRKIVQKDQKIPEKSKTARTKSESSSKKPSRKEKKEESNASGEPASKTTSDSKVLMNKTESDLNAIDFICDKLNAKGEKYNLKICSWNVSGLRALVKKNGFDYIKKEAADIIVLQEIKCEDSKLPDEVRLPGYERHFMASKKPGYSGVALFSKIKTISVTKGIPKCQFNDEGRIITAEYQNFYVINVYVPNAGNKLVTLPKRLEWNAIFKEYVTTLNKKKPVIICGDMNVAHQEIDLTNPQKNTKNAGFTQEERDGMTEFLKEGFVDIFRHFYPDKTGAYTFWSYFNNARGKNIGWRLDYFITSERIKDSVCDIVIRDKVYGSDHCPIILYINLNN